MTQANDGGPGLVRVDDFEGELEEHWQDAQGLKVSDKNGEEIGTVEDLYVYEEASAVHLLKVEIEGSYFLIPIDAVTNVTDESVEVEQNKGTIMESSEHDSEDVPDLETSRAVYDHFGYPDQLALGKE